MALQKPWCEKPLTRDELACIYSALILVDDDLPITEEKINTILAAAEIEVESIWPQLFARALQGVNVRELITSVSGLACVGAAPGAPGVGDTTTAAGEADDKPADAPAPPPEEDSDEEDFGLGLFD